MVGSWRSWDTVGGQLGRQGYWSAAYLWQELLLKSIIGKVVFTFLSVCASQVGRPEPEKERFYDQLQYAVIKFPAIEILILVGDFNDHVGTPAGVFNNAHGGHGFGAQNKEGEEKIMGFAIDNGLCVGNISRRKMRLWSHTALVATQPS